MPDIVLLVDGVEYSGWKSVEVRRDIERLAATFYLEVTRKEPFPIAMASACELFLDGEKVISGYVDAAQFAISSDAHTVAVGGRDKTGDLVDCTAMNDAQEFTDIGFAALIGKIVSPFGIGAQVKVEAEKFGRFSLQQETAWEAIERACRLRGCFANTTAEGDIIIEPFAERTADVSLTLGENVKEATAEYDYAGRYSDYIARGQQAGTDFIFGEAAAAPSGKARDLKVKRYRPLVVLAEGQVSIAVAKERAQWEAAVRAARSVSINVTVQGWRQKPGGRLWRINELVRCDLSAVNINEEMLIKDVSFRVDDSGGTVTTLGLTRPDAYQRQPDLQEEPAGMDFWFL
ncbi:hypothetical protein VF14_18385 [Nostoc linckia z18]|uniref:Phage tail protein n=2 Tax=Nostoc linckia TaxID=92942 RepID=A0A9Q5Z952_NOSLI|nr:hypothetical protein [Nostoc linckia]PHJ81966.1 hypothetical protein VF07_29145 [Nostoc linckia z6]PHJ92864.1 hypothetical protein VF04_27860 [Nostoc linckia z7]PHK00813.1 hypothetical protein VF08_23385 [Nostoc linckia z8]PHK09309.1 hypothetical protein VF09_15920 [Nostoc linckia z9]PHK33087.1 hypothetical protein VF14_18385 [Nostoc linckia z18]